MGQNIIEEHKIKFNASEDFWTLKFTKENELMLKIMKRFGVNINDDAEIKKRCKKVYHLFKPDIEQYSIDNIPVLDVKVIREFSNITIKFTEYKGGGLNAEKA